MKFEIWHLLLLMAVILNAIVTAVIARRSDLDTFQRNAQIIIVWLTPFIGAIGLWLFHRSNDHVPASKKPLGGGTRDSVDFGPSNGIGSGD